MCVLAVLPVYDAPVDLLIATLYIYRASDVGICYLAIVVQDIFFLGVIASEREKPVLSQGCMSQRVCDVSVRSKDF